MNTKLESVKYLCMSYHFTNVPSHDKGGEFVLGNQLSTQNMIGSLQNESYRKIHVGRNLC